MYHSDDYAIGFSYIFGKNSESVKAEEIGTAATSYYAFLDKGLMYGAYETWEGSGIHLNESGMNGFPIKELSHGAAAQFQWKAFYVDVEYSQSGNFTLDLSFLKRKCSTIPTVKFDLVTPI